VYFVDTLTDIFVTWNTANDTEESIVVYWDDGFIMTANGTYALFVSGGNETRKQYIHRVKMPNLTPGRKYSKLDYLNLTIVKLPSPSKVVFNFAMYEEGTLIFVHGCTVHFFKSSLHLKEMALRRDNDLIYVEI
jgi:hypothetical protein